MECNSHGRENILANIKKQASQSSQVRPPHPQTKSHRSPRQPEPAQEPSRQPAEKQTTASQPGGPAKHPTAEKPTRARTRQRGQDRERDAGGEGNPRSDRGGGRKEPVQASLLAQPVKNQQKRESSCCVGPSKPRGGRPSQASPCTFASWFP